MERDLWRSLAVRPAGAADLPAIQRIYNQGIEDRIATLDSEPKNMQMMREWWTVHQHRYAVLVAHADGEVVGWVSLNPYSSRAAYHGVAELSLYIDRQWRNHGVGHLLLTYLETVAVAFAFYKIVLFTFPHNIGGQHLYRKMGYREVGIFYQQGLLDGHFVDIMAMEKFLGTVQAAQHPDDGQDRSR
jgi:phosphinothricin acetyltransferase